MRRRKLPIAIAVLLVIAAIAIAVYLRSRTAPEAARLLPENTDAVLYIDAGTIRRVASLVGQTPTIPHDPEYERFIQATGFQFERDLEKVAFAVQSAKPTATSSGAAPAPPLDINDWRSSEIFVAHFDSERLSNYLKSLATFTEHYRDVDIYNIPNDGRTVRVAILGVGLAAVSNTEDAGPIHEIIDHYKEVALPFGGPALLRGYYHDVPTASVVWGIARIASDTQPGLVQPSILHSLVPGSVVVASIRYLGSIQMRLTAFAKDEETAKQYSSNAGTMLNLFRSIESNVQAGGADPDVKAFFDSLSVEQEGKKATLKATLPVAFLKKVLTEPPALPVTPTPSPTPKPAPKKRRHRAK